MIKLVSIVIPIYNTEIGLFNRCMHSVMNQTFRDLEIIIVNDGSNDQIYQLCDCYCSLDNRVKVIHILNSGVSTARNIGTSHATGQYVMFVDSDDLLADYAVYEAVHIAEANKSDYVLGALQRIDTHDSFMPRQKNIQGLIKNYRDNQIDIVRRAFLTHDNKLFTTIDNNGYINRGPCARLIRIEIVKQEEFDKDLTLGEDVEWNMRVLRRCNVVTIVPQIWYGYLCYQTSSLRRYYGNRAERLEYYLIKLLRVNRNYFELHKAEYAINMATVFYHMIVLDYLSSNNKASVTKKNKEIKQILNRYPWCLLLDKEYYKNLRKRYKILISTSQIGLGYNLVVICQILRGFQG